MNPEEEEQQYQEQPVYQDQAPQYYEDDPIYEERVPPLIDVSVFRMPFWLQISLLSAAILVLGVTAWLGHSRYQGFQITQLEAPSQESLSDSSLASETHSPADVGLTGLEESPLPVDNIAGGWFYSNRINLKFQVPPGWVEVGDVAVTLPPGVENTKFILLQPNTGCVIAGADFNREAADYVQTSFGGRVIGDISQFDGSWFTNQAYHADPIQFSDHTRQHLSNELRDAYNLNDIDLLLWHNNANSVPESCNQDFESLLTSVAHHYQAGQPEQYENINFFIREIRYRSGDSLSKLLYQSAVDGNTYELLTLLARPTSLDLFLVDNRLYYVGAKKVGVGSQAYSQNQEIYFIDLESYGQGVVSRPDSVSHPDIASFYVTENGLYYLSGTTDIIRCTDGPAQNCSLALNRIDLHVTRNHEVLASSTPATNFIGYSKDQDALFMYTGYGDAGCVGLQMYIYENGGVSTGPQLGGCIENMVEGINGPTYDEYISEMDKLKAEVKLPSGSAISRQYSEFSLSDEDLSSYRIFMVE